MEVYNSTGQLIHLQKVPDLPPAEHHIPVPALQWQKGLYLIKICIGNQEEVKELLVM